jgi:hypothetical protein
LAEQDAGPGLVGHGLNRRQACQKASGQGQENQAEKNTAEEFGIRLNCRTHVDTPQRFAAMVKLMNHFTATRVT